MTTGVFLFFNIWHNISSHYIKAKVSDLNFCAPVLVCGVITDAISKP